MIKLRNFLSENRTSQDKENILRSMGFEWDEQYKLYRKDCNEPPPEGDYMIRVLSPNKFQYEHYDSWRMDNIVEDFNSFEELIKYLKMIFSENYS